MPSNTAPTITKSRGWVRSGCSRCKTRKKKCDEAKPRCQQCVRLGLDCNYDSIWKPLATQTNKPLRRKRVSPSQGPESAQSRNQTAPRPDLHEPDQLDDQPDELVALEPLAARPRGATLCIPAPASSTQRQHHVAWRICHAPLLSVDSLVHPDDTGYLLYYTERLSSLLVMVDAPSNPLRHMIIPRMASSPMLRKAVCAVSACHLLQRSESGTGSGSSSSDGTFAVRNYGQALHDLTRCLARYEDTELASGAVDQIVLTAVFLCKYEIIRGSTREWRHHLTGLLQLMKHPVTVSGLSPEAKRFLHSFITYHCQVAAITLGRSDVFSLALEPVGPENELDTYMGFTKRIVQLFGQISCLTRIRDSDEAFREVLSIYNSLEAWSIDTYSASDDLPSSSIEYLQSAAVAYHSSAVLYFHSVAESLPALQGYRLPWQEPQDEDAATTSTTSTTAALVKYMAVMDCFDALCNIPDGMPSESALVLPLFIMGCESEFPAQQMYAIQRLRRLESTVCLGNISRARAVVEHVRASSTQPLRSEHDGGGPRWSRATDSLGWDLIVT